MVQPNPNKRRAYLRIGNDLNITNSKQSEESLRQLPTTYNTDQVQLSKPSSGLIEAVGHRILEDTPIAIALTDPQGYLLHTNLAFQNLLGYSDTEFQGKTLAELTHPDYQDVDSEVLSHLLNHIVESYRSHKIYITKDNHLIWVELNVSLLKQEYTDTPICLVACHDISEWKFAEIELRNYQNHLEELVDERTIELTKLNQKLAWQASHDSLTGLINRLEFKKMVEEACWNANAYNQKHTLCYLDLDRFKVVNDSCGHAAGDELLRQISFIFQRKCRKTDSLARLGGDEFGILLYQCSVESALEVLTSLHKAIQEFRFVWQNQTFSIGISIGAVEINSTSHNSDIVLGKADTACYAAKNRGRDRIHIYEVNDRELTQQKSEMQWLTRLCEALEQNQFCLYSQPLLALSESLKNKRHCEVLIRLPDENGKLLSPGAFLPAAERYHLMPKIDRWVIRKCFTILSQNYEAIGDHTLFMINLSGASVNDDSFLDFLKEQLSIYRIPAQCICFEITETVAITNLSKAAKFISDLQAMGLLFALDDFGSGMSSFTYLKNLPVDYVKIDGGLIEDMVNDPVSHAMVEAINQVGHLMNVRTIAEYVSDETILKAVNDLKMDFAQGYCIARPHPLKFP